MEIRDYGAISGALFGRLAFRRLLLEYAPGHDGGFGPLAGVRPGTTVVPGLLTTKTGRLEDAVAARVAGTAAVKPLGERAISTQCGFAPGAIGTPVTPGEQPAKPRLVAALAGRLWPR